jgi:hypothetical protein
MSILPQCIRPPASPIARDYRPASGQRYKVKDDDSWVTLARDKGMSPWELIRYNYPGLPSNEQQAAREVNWYLQEYVGCAKLTADRTNYCFSSAANPGQIWLPGRMNSSIYNLVPVMRQPLSGSCWYTSLQMVVKYWRDKGLGDVLVDNNLIINDPLTGMRTWDYDFFMSQYLLQTAERPLVYAP